MCSPTDSNSETCENINNLINDKTENRREFDNISEKYKERSSLRIGELGAYAIVENSGI